MKREFDELTEEIIAFATERGWERHHNPKHLVMALSVEVAELMEHFQWLDLEAADNLSKPQLDEVADEIADVQWYLLELASRLGISIPEAIRVKKVKNAKKYPAGVKTSGGEEG